MFICKKLLWFKEKISNRTRYCNSISLCCFYSCISVQLELQSHEYTSFSVYAYFVGHVELIEIHVKFFNYLDLYKLTISNQILERVNVQLECQSMLILMLIQLSFFIIQFNNIKLLFL